MTQYNEEEILKDLTDYVLGTYKEHYIKDDLQCFDVWKARGTAGDTAIDTAIKYLWRYGEKEGKNKKDLMKAIHYIILALHVDFYQKQPAKVEIDQPNAGKIENWLFSPGGIVPAAYEQKDPLNTKKN